MGSSQDVFDVALAGLSGPLAALDDELRDADAAAARHETAILAVLAELTEALPGPHARGADAFDHDRWVTRFAVHHPQVPPVFEQLLASGRIAPDSEEAFAAATTAMSCYRRRGRPGEGRRVAGLLQGFDELPLYQHFVARAYTGSGAADLERGLELAHRSFEQDPDNDHALHNRALLALELWRARRESRESPLLRDARRDIETLVRDRRAVRSIFHHTYAMIMQAGGDLEAAITHVDRAVELEDPAAIDHHRRVTRQLALRESLIAQQESERGLAERAREIDQQLDTKLAELESGQTRVIEAIAVVGAFIAFLAASAGVLGGATDDVLVAAVLVLGLLTAGGLYAMITSLILRRPTRDRAAPREAAREPASG